MVHYGIEGPCMALCGLVWLYVALYGFMWPFMALCGLLLHDRVRLFLPYMASYGLTWSYMAFLWFFYGKISILLELYCLFSRS